VWWWSWRGGRLRFQCSKFEARPPNLWTRDTLILGRWPEFDVMCSCARADESYLTLPRTLSRTLFSLLPKTYRSLFVDIAEPIIPRITQQALQENHSSRWHRTARLRSAELLEAFLDSVEEAAQGKVSLLMSLSKQ